MNKFKRILLASGLAATASLMANSPAFAGTTGRIDLSGTIPYSLSLTLNPTSNVGNLSLVPGQRTGGVKIGSLTNVATNSSSGLRVAVSSSWLLKSGDNSIPIVDFSEADTATATSPQRTWDTVAGSPLDGSSSEGRYLVLGLTSSFQAGAARDSSLFISYVVPANAPAGTYTGSIVFTVQDR
jgi:hypothetical protein